MRYSRTCYGCAYVQRCAWTERFTSTSSLQKAVVTASLLTSTLILTMTPNSSSLPITVFAFSALTLLVGRQEGHLHMAQRISLPLTVSCFSKIQVGFTFLVPTQVVPDKGPLNGCVCVCVCYSRLIGHVRSDLEDDSYCMPLYGLKLFNTCFGQSTMPHYTAIF